MFTFHSKTNPRVTVVAEQQGDEVKFAASRCSFRDNFSRKKGRMIASGRLRKGKVVKVVEGSLDAHQFIAIAQNISESIAAAAGPVRASV